MTDGPFVSIPNMGPSGGWLESLTTHELLTGGTVKKSDREIMEILEALDATGCAHSAADRWRGRSEDRAPVRQARDEGAAGR